MATGQQGQRTYCESPNGPRHSTTCGGASAHQHVCASSYFQTSNNERTSISSLPGYRDFPLKLQRENMLSAS